MSQPISPNVPIDHGEITVRVPAAKPEPFIPHVLRLGVIITGIPHAEAVEKYGLWELRAVTDFMAAGHNIEKGDTVKLPGNDAVFLVQDGRAVFVDDQRMKDEAQVFADAAKLNLPQNLRQLAAFAKPKGK
jgi:hypothetical protein